MRCRNEDLVADLADDLPEEEAAEEDLGEDALAANAPGAQPERTVITDLLPCSYSR